MAKLNRRKAAGPDGLRVEHLQLWLVVQCIRNVMNAVVELEEVLSVLNLVLLSLWTRMMEGIP